MDYNVVLSAALSAIIGDAELGNMLDEIRAVKGPRRPESWAGKNCFTLHVLSNPRDSDFKTHNGTLRVNHYCPSHADGNADVKLMGQVMERLIELYDDRPPVMAGYEVFNWAVNEPLGPLYDSEAEGEHYSSLSISFFIRKI